MQSREILRSKGPRASHQRVIPNLLQTHAHKFQRTEKLKAKKSPEVPIPQRNTSIRAIKVRPSFVNSSQKKEQRRSTRPILINVNIQNMLSSVAPKLNQSKQTQLRQSEWQCQERVTFQQPHKSTQIIKEFEEEIDSINERSGRESMCYLERRSLSYKVDGNYLARRQRNCTWKMRAILVDWIMQVSSVFQLKRQTFHITIYLIDRFLQAKPNILKNQLQLIGVGCMYLVSKLEQIQPKSCQQFQQSCSGCYSISQIKKIQCSICSILKYQLHPPTLNRWALLLMTQWDYFLDKYYPENIFDSSYSLPIYLKRMDSYQHCLELSQLIDCTLLDVQTYQYNFKNLACAFIYLYLGYKMGCYPLQMIGKEFGQASLYLFEETKINAIYSHFLETTLFLTLKDLLAEIQYAATFFILPLNVGLSMNFQTKCNVTFEEFASFQSFNTQTFRTAMRRRRSFDD